MTINKDTKLDELIARFPWLKEEAIKLDDRAKVVNTPVGKVLLKKYTIEDVSKRTGAPVNEILKRIETLVNERRAKNNG